MIQIDMISGTAWAMPILNKLQQQSWTVETCFYVGIRRAFDNYE